MKPMNYWIVALVVSMFGMACAQQTSYKKLKEEYAAAVEAYKKCRGCNQSRTNQNATPRK